MTEAVREHAAQRVPSAPFHSDDAPTRLDGLEQAVDSIAIEVERISEGRRFLTRVLTRRL